MKKTLLIIIAYAVLLFPQEGFIKGADISFIPQIEDLNGTYTVNGIAEDPVKIFKDNDLNYIRLRLWHTPANGYCGLASTLEMAERIKQDSLKFLLDIHYSDTWADPAHQQKPAAWSTLSYLELIDSVYAYTFNVMQAFDSVNALPDMVQIGNEIIGGFLWPEGRVGGSYNTTQQWSQFTNLLKTARNAIIDALPDTTIRIMIHIDRGGDNGGSRWFYDNLNNYSVPFDVIGLSFYPWWHGTLTLLSNNLNDLAGRYNKDIVVVETAYPWTLQAFDNVNNIVGLSSQLHSGYPATVQGQFNFIYDIINIVRDVQNNKGLGVFYWAPEYISVQPIGSPWENLALFDFGGETLSSIDAFHDPDTSGSISVTFRLNTSTNWDTLHTNAFVQIRGEVVNSSNILASGELISWDENSELIMDNVYGDYWEKTVRVIPGSEINYRYWTGHTLNNPTFLRFGFEGPITPYDSSSINHRKFIAGDKDTVLQVEYYNSTGSSPYQYWKPFEDKEDSVAVYLRVNMGGVTSTNFFDPDVNGPVGVRGAPVNSQNILSWSESKFLTREESSVMNGSFWSGVVYYPEELSGEIQLYNFYIENSSGNGLENISERAFQVPFEDATIHWTQFQNQPVIVSVDDEKNIADEFYLHQNYPNPFNPNTKINYDLNKSEHVKIVVYNSLGEELNILVNDFKNRGNHSIEWNGKDKQNNYLPSGVYFIKLITQTKFSTIKALFLK